MPEEIGDMTGHKSQLKIKQAALSGETQWISCMESLGKDSPTHYFLSAADLSPFTGRKIPEHFNGSLFSKKRDYTVLQLSPSCIVKFICCFNAGVSQPAAYEDCDFAGSSETIL